MKDNIAVQLGSVIGLTAIFLVVWAIWMASPSDTPERLLEDMIGASVLTRQAGQCGINKARIEEYKAALVKKFQQRARRFKGAPDEKTRKKIIAKATASMKAVPAASCDNVRKRFRTAYEEATSSN